VCVCVWKTSRERERARGGKEELREPEREQERRESKREEEQQKSERESDIERQSERTCASFRHMCIDLSALVIFLHTCNDRARSQSELVTHNVTTYL